MIPTFAWAVLRPSIVSPLCVLALGFCCDLVWGGRLGLWELGLLSAFGFILVTRNMMSGQSRTMLWAWYAAACALAMGVAYAAVVMETGNPPSLLAVAGQWLPTALLYPVADRLIGRFEDADPRFR
jgi:rod shape-determining protein MreD